MFYEVFEMRKVRALIVVAGLLVLGAGCGEEPEESENTNNDEEISYDEFKPFDQQNMSSQLARLEQHSEIVRLRKEADASNATEKYTEIEAEYEATDLNQKVVGRTDYHVELEGWGFEDIGEFLDTQIVEAIEIGKTSEDEAEIAWAGQVIDKGLQVFFYHSVYYELYKGQRKNFDEAFGYYGLDTDGEPLDIGVLANNAAGREAEFSLTINRPIFESFIDARHAMAEGTESNEDVIADDNEAYNEAWATIDNKMLEILGYYAIHEIDVIEESNIDIKIIEARIIWEALAPYAEHVDSELATSIMDKLYPAGVPSKDDEGYFYSGLEDIRTGDVEIEQQELRTEMGEVMQTLE